MNQKSKTSPQLARMLGILAYGLGQKLAIATDRDLMYSCHAAF